MNVSPLSSRRLSSVRFELLCSAMAFMPGHRNSDTPLDLHLRAWHLDPSIQYAIPHDPMSLSKEMGSGATMSDIHSLHRETSENSGPSRQSATFRLLSDTGKAPGTLQRLSARSWRWRKSGRAGCVAPSLTRLKRFFFLASGSKHEQGGCRRAWGSGPGPKLRGPLRGPARGTAAHARERSGVELQWLRPGHRSGRGGGVPGGQPAACELPGLRSQQPGGSHQALGLLRPCRPWSFLGTKCR